MHPEVIDVLGHLSCDISYEKHYWAQDDNKENSEHEYTLPGDCSEQCFNNSGEVSV